MRRLLLLVLLALLFAAPAAAAGRVLLAPADAAQGLARSASATPALAGLRQTAAKSGKLRVIVGLRVPFAAEMALPAAERTLQRAEIASAGIGLRGRFSAAIARNPGAVRSYSAIPFMAIEVSRAELERLARDPDVISLAPDAMIPLALKESTQLVRAPEAWALGYSGLGQTVAVVDTGVDKTHPFLTGKVVAEACYSQGGSCPGSDPTRSTAPGSGMPCAQADCRHGTHVAGIAAGKGDLYSGVARDASLIAIQVFSPYYSSVAAASSDILAGLNRVYELRESYKIAAMNLSLGGSRFTSACDATDPAAFAIFANLRAAGIATVVASGNDGFTDSLSWPACYSNAVSVGAVSDEGWGSCYGEGPTAADKVACFSNTASFLSLLAPGASIFSSVPGGFFTSLNGTSMAAPHVAGAFAVLRQKFPNESVTNLLDRLKNTGRQVGDYRVPEIVKPRIDVAAALGPSTSLRLSFIKAGAGDGSVLITGPGLSQRCATSCMVSVAAGSQVTVTAQPTVGSLFGAWSGACSGSGKCSFTMQSDATLTASFTQQVTYVLRYERKGLGSGSVTFAPAGGSPACSTSCLQSYPAGMLVRVTAQTEKDMIFTGWSGACSGTGRCQITMQRAATLAANFAPGSVTLTYEKLGKGQGSVAFLPAGGQASCGSNCVQRYKTGTAVNLVATPARNMRFTGWSGACSGTGGCRLTLSEPKAVRATFQPR